MNVTEHRRKEKDQASKRIQQDTEKFIKDGGKVQKIPAGQLSDYNERVSKEMAERARKAGKTNGQMNSKKHFNTALKGSKF
jgi:hypothetical protein